MALPAPTTADTLRTAVPCQPGSTTSASPWSCAATMAAFAAFPGTPSSLADLYDACRTTMCEAPLRDYYAAAAATGLRADRSALVTTAQALDACGLAKCPAQYAAAHALVCVPMASIAASSTAATLGPDPQSWWLPAFVPKALAGAVAAASSSSTDIGVCSLGWPAGSPCEPPSLLPATLAMASSLPLAPALVIAGLSAAASVGTAATNGSNAQLLPILAPLGLADGGAAVINNNAVQVAIPAASRGLPLSLLTFPANYYVLQRCDKPSRSWVSNLAPEAASCTSTLDCMLGTCDTIRAVCTTAVGMGRFNSDGDKQLFTPVANITARSGAIPVPTAGVGSPSSPAGSSSTGLGPIGPVLMYSIAIVLAPTVLLALGVAAFLASERKKRSAPFACARDPRPSSSPPRGGAGDDAPLSARVRARLASVLGGPLESVLEVATPTTTTSTGVVVGAGVSGGSGIDDQASLPRAPPSLAREVLRVPAPPGASPYQRPPHRGASRSRRGNRMLADVRHPPEHVLPAYSPFPSPISTPAPSYISHGDGGGHAGDESVLDVDAMSVVGEADIASFGGGGPVHSSSSLAALGLAGLRVNTSRSNLHHQHDHDDGDSMPASPLESDPWISRYQQQPRMNETTTPYGSAGQASSSASALGTSPDSPVDGGGGSYLMFTTRPAAAVAASAAAAAGGDDHYYYPEVAQDSASVFTTTTWVSASKTLPDGQEDDDDRVDGEMRDQHLQQQQQHGQHHWPGGSAAVSADADNAVPPVPPLPANLIEPTD